MKATRQYSENIVVMTEVDTEKNTLNNYQPVKKMLTNYTNDSEYNDFSGKLDNQIKETYEIFFKSPQKSKRIHKKITLENIKYTNEILSVLK